jgi:antitoxin component of RelBE/YafQ-DinJ toxin-antitoxin module
MRYRNLLIQIRVSEEEKKNFKYNADNLNLSIASYVKLLNEIVNNGGLKNEKMD